VHRISSAPRPSWREIVREQAAAFAGTDVPEALHRWDETACYVLTLREVLRLEAITEELYGMCLAAARHIVMNSRYPEFGLPDWAAAGLRRSLASYAPSLYSCLDFWYDGTGPPKLLDFHPDCPPALVESAIIQYYWLDQVKPDDDQWNQLHERLVEGWQGIMPRLGGKTVHCGWSELDTVGTEQMTVGYIAETVRQAGLIAAPIPMRSIGWDGARFLDEQAEPIVTCFKLYPWSWMLREPYGKHALAETNPIHWLEPAWKLLLASPALHALLWELYPGHPRDLPEYDTIPLPGNAGQCYRLASPLPTFEGQHVALSTWVVTDADGKGKAAGAGFRESIGPTMAGYARFIPHVVSR
jgi:glutathionylspermidine synthase